MHQQIVYTRCKPRRELSTGKVINEAGFGIHNFSQNILLSEYMDDPQFIEEIWKKHNAAKEKGSNSTGLFYSYQYFYRATGKSIMVQEYLRPYNPSEVRTNGQDNRPGTYIKQYLIGEFKEYPCLLFGAACWDAAEMSASSYYHDNGEPLDYLPEISPQFKPIDTFQNVVRKFIQDGREICIKKLVAIVASEMIKPIETRRYIVIKDYPENVELWISALELSLPLYLAEQISFSTNEEATGELSKDNTFYSDQKGKYINLYESEAISAGGKKNFFFMLLGIHPTASGSAAIEYGKNYSKYIVLDGELKDIEAPSALSVTAPYFEAVTQMNEDIRDFNMLLSELKQIHFDSQFNDIFKLFDAYKYLLDSESSPDIWSYEKLKKYLSIFKQYETTPFRWSQYLSEKAYDAYSQFYEIDHHAGFALLKLIISMDHNRNLQPYIEQLLLDKYLYELKTKSIQVKQVSELYSSICSMYPTMVERLSEGFKKNVPVFMDYVSNWNPEQAYFMFSTLFKCFNCKGLSFANWYKDECCSTLIDALLHIIWTNRKETINMLSLSKQSPLYLELALKGIKQNFSEWVVFICETIDDAKLELVCGVILDYENCTLKLYEELLVGLLNKNKSSIIIFKSFLKAIDKFGVNNDEIDPFIFSFLNKYKEKPSELRYLLRIIDENDIGKKNEETTYQTIQKYLEIAPGEREVFSLAQVFEKHRKPSMNDWGRSYTLAFIYELECANSDNIDAILDQYSAELPIAVNVSDMKLILNAMGKRIESNKFLVKVYHIISKSEFIVRTKILAIDIDDVDIIKRFIQLTDKSNQFNYDPWRKQYKSTINAISEDFYQLIKDANIDKMEKAVMRSLLKKDPNAEFYKQFFSNLKNRVREEKEQEKLELRRSKIEAKKLSDQGTGDKKGLFSKLFGKK